MRKTIFALAAAAVSFSNVTMAIGVVYTCRLDVNAVAYAKPVGGGYIVELYKANQPRLYNMPCIVDWSADIVLNCMGTDLDGISRTFLMRRDLSFAYSGSENPVPGPCQSRNFGD